MGTISIIRRNRILLPVILILLVLVEDSSGKKVGRMKASDKTNDQLVEDDAFKVESAADISGCEVVDLDADITNYDASNTCLFPFIFNGRIFKTCTTIDNDPNPWCATSVDEFGNMETWAYCEDSCPGFTSDPIQVHPDNEAGSCSCGVPNVMNKNRIVGGEETLIAEYPWQVALLFNSENVQAQGCGGALVGTEYVVTAAHCTIGNDPADVFVAIGETILGVASDAESFVVGVEIIINHPDYDDDTTENDISILKLVEPIDLESNPHIKPICLPQAGSIFAGEKAVIAGWGSIESAQPSVAHLLSADIEIFPDDDCGAVTDVMTSDMICAGLKEGGKDTCQGDSGGPMIAKDEDNNGAATLVGVVSWGYGCADAGSPGVYAEVSHFVDWLEENMPDLSTCSPPAESTWIIGDKDDEPPVPPTIPPPTTCMMEKKQFLKSKKLKTIKKVKKVQDCISKCEQDPGCDYYRWNKRGKKCELFTMVYKSNKNFISGPITCRS